MCLIFVDPAMIDVLTPNVEVDINEKAIISIEIEDGNPRMRNATLLRNNGNRVNLVSRNIFINDTLLEVPVTSMDHYGEYIIVITNRGGESRAGFTLSGKLESWQF